MLGLCAIGGEFWRLPSEERSELTNWICFRGIFFVSPDRCESTGLTRKDLSSCITATFLFPSLVCRTLGSVSSGVSGDALPSLRYWAALLRVDY